MRPTITVAIPSYNKETEISRCIESVLQNSAEVDQIIIVDNKSTDKTFEIAKSYEPLISCIQNDSNVGMSGNFNRCIELCQTDWLMILHADDILLPGAIKKYRTLIEKYPNVGIIHADSYCVINNDETSKSHYPRQSREFYTAGVEALSCTYGICSAVMVKMDAYNKLGNFIVTSLSSDVEMWARVAAHYPAGSINEPTAVYYSNINSTGPQSLIKRSVKDIKDDWDNLTYQISLHYPEGDARNVYLAKIRKDTPGNNFAIVKANLRARNWQNVFTGLKLIIIDDHDLWPLIKIAAGISLRRSKIDTFLSSLKLKFVRFFPKVHKN